MGDFHTVNNPTTISNERFEDLLCSALEGGVSYWADTYTSLIPSQEGDEDIEFSHLAFNHPNYLIHVSDREAGGQSFKLNLKSLKKGMEIWARDCPYHFNNFLTEDDDAITADTFFQCAVFGKVIYG